MQIKRFEASDMNEALRLVKEEFGENAVIISAKEMRPVGFFKGIRKKSVEITAAIDTDTIAASQTNKFSERLLEQLDTESETDRVTLTSKHGPSAPKKKMSCSRSRLLSTHESAKTFVESKIEEPISEPFREKEEPVLTTPDIVSEKKPVCNRIFLSDACSSQVSPPFYTRLNRRKVIALVGLCGTGKSTCVAKLAWHCTVVEKKRVALISLDRFTIGANSMLVAISRIMNLPLVVIYDADQLQFALNDLKDADVVLIDTPGLNKKNENIIEEIDALLRQSKPDEIHLVTNATVRKAVFTANVDMFISLGVNRLLFTHVEETLKGKSLSEMKNAVDLPVEFYSDSVDFFDGLNEASLKWLQELFASGASAKDPMASDRRQLTALSREGFRKENNAMKINLNNDFPHVVVNRNSELFHHPDCRSVRQINEANITLFCSMEKAMEKGFKPCQACCGWNPMEIKDPSYNFASAR